MTSKLPFTSVCRMAVFAAAVLVAVPSALAGGKETDAPNAPAADNPGTALAVPAAPEDRAKVLEELFDRLAKAKTPAEADPLKSQIRAQWLNSGSPTIDLLLVRDAQAGLAKDSALRRRLLEAVTHLAPASLEGWNRRAELDYSDGRLGEAMADIGHVLMIEPRHFDALEGLAAMLKETGRNGLALKAFRQLKAIDPTSANIQTEIDELARKVEGQKI